MLFKLTQTDQTRCVLFRYVSHFGQFTIFGSVWDVIANICNCFLFINMKILNIFTLFIIDNDIHATDNATEARIFGIGENYSYHVKVHILFDHFVSSKKALKLRNLFKKACRGKVFREII